MVIATIIVIDKHRFKVYNCPIAKIIIKTKSNINDNCFSIKPTILFTSSVELCTKSAREFL